MTRKRRRKSAQKVMWFADDGARVPAAYIRRILGPDYNAARAAIIQQGHVYLPDLGVSGSATGAGGFGADPSEEAYLEQTRPIVDYREAVAKKFLSLLEKRELPSELHPDRTLLSREPTDAELTERRTGVKTYYRGRRSAVDVSMGGYDNDLWPDSFYMLSNYIQMRAEEGTAQSVSRSFPAHDLKINVQSHEDGGVSWKLVYRTVEMSGTGVRGLEETLESLGLIWWG